MGAENPALYPHRTGDARLWVGSRCTVLRRSWRRPVRASGSAIRFRTKRVMVMVMSRTGRPHPFHPILAQLGRGGPSDA